MDSRLAMTEVACPLCRSRRCDLTVVGRDNEHDLIGDFSVVTCGECGHSYTNPQPSVSSFDVLYPSDYGAFTEDYGGRLSSIKRTYGQFVQFGGRPSPAGGDMLEIGCGTGSNLLAHQERGWLVRGIEPSSSAVATACRRGLDVVVGTDEMVDDFEPGSFDEIHALMVLEHVADPVETLRRLRRVARSTARLVVSVPDFACPERGRFGANWFALQLPRHLQHFSSRTLAKALDQAGWHVEREWRQPTLIDSIKSLEVAYGSRRFRRWFFVGTRALRAVNLLLLPVIVVVARVRPTGRMTVFARPAERSDRK